VDAPEGVTVLGGKTGTTEPAGHCLIILSQNAAEDYFISVVMKTDSLEELYSDMNLLLSEIPN
jgi:D-alanyl-D-alanine carboxypeptidase (penicillin-binding protein 5/6)